MDDIPRNSNPSTVQPVKMETVRKWQILEKETRLKFYCNGRLVSGPGKLICIALLSHMTAVVTLFLCYDGNHYLEGKILFGRWGVPFLVILIYFLTLLAIFKTIFTEPGYVERPSSEEQKKNFLRYIATTKYPVFPSGTKRYCQICQMKRPPQVSHCRVCNVCFKRSDHHCDILGVCIAKRNYSSFFLFTISLTAFYGLIVGVGLHSFIEILCSEWDELTREKLMFPAFYLALVGFIYPPCGLMFMVVTPIVHFYQVLTNRTSKDRAHGIWPENTPNTFRGWIVASVSNCSRILCPDPIASELSAREVMQVPVGYLKTLSLASKPNLTKEIYEAATEDLVFRDITEVREMLREDPKADGVGRQAVCMV